MLVYAAICLAAVCSADEPLRIIAEEDPRRIAVTYDLPAAVADSLPRERISFDAGLGHVRLELIERDGATGPPIFARYRLDGRRLILTPRYPLVPGESYRASAIVAPGNTITAEYRVPELPEGEAPSVTGIFPSGDSVPANHLKFYIHFSQPMREGRAIFDQISLLDDEDKPIPDPWRRAELWTANARRFTLWIHPGRVKQGVNLREEFGPVLEPHRTYRLVVGAEVRDAKGRPLGRPFIKRFTTTPNDQERPLPSRWRLKTPEAGSRQPLVVEFDKPLDHALLLRLMTIEGPDGTGIAGTASTGNAETSWRFSPREEWGPGKHALRIDGRLEDLAGNTPLRIFDEDLLEAPSAAAEVEVVGEELRRVFVPGGGS